MGWSDIKRQARIDIHANFTWPATYTPPGVGATPLSVSVRRHTKILTEGDIQSLGYAQVVEDVNRVVFLASEVTPEIGGVVTFEDGFSYTVSVVHPYDGEPVIRCDVMQN